MIEVLHSPFKNVASIRLLSPALRKHVCSLTSVAVDDYKDSHRSYRNHLGMIEKKCVQIPKMLEKTVKLLVENKDHVQLSKDVQSLVNYLWSRQLPLDVVEARQKWVNMKKELTDKGVADSKLDDEVSKHLRHVSYQWQPVQYDQKLALMYLLGRLAYDYSAIYRVLRELKQRDENLVPRTLLDFGSGVGSVMWAVRAVWPEAPVDEYLGVDVSEEMHDMSRLLLRGGNPDADPTVPNVYHRQYLPVRSKADYDIVVSAFSLMELPGLKERCDTVDYLWRRARRHVVLLENGTAAGYRAVADARQYLLDTYGSQTHVVAPCPHDAVCPRYSHTTPCTFPLKYWPLTHTRATTPAMSHFSYTVIMKRARPPDDPRWPRLVQPVLRRPRHVVCRLCTADGSLAECIVSKGKSDRALYRSARVSSWGDRLPLTTPPSEHNT